MTYESVTNENLKLKQKIRWCRLRIKIGDLKNTMKV